MTQQEAAQFWPLIKKWAEGGVTDSSLLKEVRKALESIADNEWNNSPGCSTKSEQLAKHALQLLGEGKDKE